MTGFSRVTSPEGPCLRHWGVGERTVTLGFPAGGRADVAAWCSREKLGMGTEEQLILIWPVNRSISIWFHSFEIRGPKGAEVDVRVIYIQTLWKPRKNSVAQEFSKTEKRITPRILGYHGTRGQKKIGSRAGYRDKVLREVSEERRNIWGIREGCDVDRAQDLGLASPFRGENVKVEIRDAFRKNEWEEPRYCWNRRFLLQHIKQCFQENFCLKNMGDAIKATIHIKRAVKSDNQKWVIL